MNRSGYSDDYDSSDFSHVRHQGSLSRAINGKRGQAFLIALIAALDALPERVLIAQEFASNGCFCALGAVANVRGIDPSNLDYDDYEALAKTFGIAESLARDVMNTNDDVNDKRWIEMQIENPSPGYPHYGRTTTSVRVPDELAPQKRWQYVRDWAQAKLIKEAQS